MRWCRSADLSARTVRLVGAAGLARQQGLACWGDLAAQEHPVVLLGVGGECSAWTEAFLPSVHFPALHPLALAWVHCLAWASHSHTPCLALCLGQAACLALGNTPACCMGLTSCRASSCQASSHPLAYPSASLASSSWACSCNLPSAYLPSYLTSSQASCRPLAHHRNHHRLPQGLLWLELRPDPRRRGKNSEEHLEHLEPAPPAAEFCHASQHTRTSARMHQ
mmetsp:Transcript_29826/g.55851  ORF Transcript_29826/g.55851 Transcript_29826/m.55851 type:complete len:223 (-) Transcript_29826:379-1047(-)